MNDLYKFPYRSMLCLLVVGFLTFSSSRLKAQSIENTSWNAYYALISDTVTIDIETDTFRVNTSSGINILKSWISITGDTMWIADITGPSTICPPTDTAHYTYIIENDSLDFTPIVDSCAQRLSVLDSTPIWREPQGPPLFVQDESLESFIFYPNPIKDIVRFELSHPAQIDILTVDGQLIRSVFYANGHHQMKPGLSGGTYICIIRSRSAIRQAIWIVQ